LGGFDVAISLLNGDHERKRNRSVIIAKEHKLDVSSQPDRSRRLDAVISVVLLLSGLFMLDLMSTAAKMLRSDYPPALVALTRNGFALLPVLLFFYWEQRRFLTLAELRIAQWRLALLRGLIVAFAQLCLYGALGHLELATTATIAYSGPFFITLLAIPFLGERVGPWRWGAVLIGFVGVVWVIRPTSDIFSWWSVLPVMAAFLYANTLVLARRFEPGTSNAVINLYSIAGASAASLLLTGITFMSVPLPEQIAAADLGLAIFTGVIGGTGVYFLTLAFRRGEASFLAPFEYFGIFSSLILGWIFFAEWPIERLFPGVILIVGAGLVIMVRGHDRRRPKA
jgi:drug/metabolite transporter (DMT)-like permease